VGIERTTGKGSGKDREETGSRPHHLMSPLKTLHTSLPPQEERRRVGKRDIEDRERGRQIETEREVMVLCIYTETSSSTAT